MRLWQVLIAAALTFVLVPLGKELGSPVLFPMLMTIPIGVMLGILGYKMKG
jgi:hypothetical protein